MIEIGMIVLIIALYIGILALPISLLVRIGFLPFSRRVRGQVRKHPLIHVLWFISAAAVVIVLGGLTSDRPKMNGKSNNVPEDTARKLAVPQH